METKKSLQTNIKQKKYNFMITKHDITRHNKAKHTMFIMKNENKAIQTKFMKIQSMELQIQLCKMHLTYDGKPKNRCYEPKQGTENHLSLKTKIKL